MKKGKYITLKIENSPDSLSSKVTISHDIYLEDKDGYTYIGEFVERKNAILFCKIKNKKEKK